MLSKCTTDVKIRFEIERRDWTQFSLFLFLNKKMSDGVNHQSNQTADQSSVYADKL